MSTLSLRIDGELHIVWQNADIEMRRQTFEDYEIVAIKRKFRKFGDGETVPTVANKPNRHRTKKIRKNR